MYQFYGCKMNKGNKSLKFYSVLGRKECKTFKEQKCYFSQYLQGSSGSKDD